jgi:hypothetical protein
VRLVERRSRSRDAGGHGRVHVPLARLQRRVAEVFLHGFEIPGQPIDLGPQRMAEVVGTDRRELRGLETDARDRGVPSAP